MAIITSSKLLTKIKAKAFLASNNAGFSNQDILDLATDELLDTIVPEIMEVHEGFLLYSEEVAVAANTGQVRIPDRAIGGSIRHIYWVDANNTRKVIDRLDQEDKESFSGSSGQVRNFIIEGNYISLLPAPSSAGTLVISFPFRPSQIVEESKCKQIQAIDYDTRTVSVASIPSSWVLPTEFDCVNYESGNEILYYNHAGTIAGNNIQFDQPIGSMKVGDWICLPREAPVAMVVEELHSYLVQLTAAEIIKQRGQTEQYKSSKEKLENIRKRIPLLINNRVQSKPFQTGRPNPFFNVGRGGFSR
ncbi:hypothetical protein [Ferrovibrio sp.]|uniref:hypothetical protein n=1 Tax=Ferrovibrio sp. TaxID=1917215 RepID=UPI000CB3AF63|nr:hypothetical protein [Ferrovibrio sp.]PJI40410.1 MAG: hypothetical protein CTR53_10390 [Ferrovibrio sp.]